MKAWAFAGEKYKNSRLGLVSSTRDSVIALFYGFGKDDCANIDGVVPSSLSEDEYAAGIAEVRESYLKQSPAWGSYFIDSTTHTWLAGDGFYSTEVQGEKLTTFTDDIVNGAGPQAHVGP